MVLTTLDPPAQVEAAAREDLHHRAVVVIDDRAEHGDVVVARDRREVLEQQRADAATVLAIGDVQRDLGGARLAVRDRHVAPHAEQRLVIAVREGRADDDRTGRDRGAQAIGLGIAELVLRPHAREQRLHALAVAGAESANRD